MSIELVRAPLCIVYNLLGNGMRRVFGAGPRRLMYRSLARRLVDDQRCFSIPLTSGMQTPIFDAVTYLVYIGDFASIPRLERLFEACLHARKSIFGFEKRLEREAACALLTFYGYRDAEKFIASNLSKENIDMLQDSTIRELFTFAVRTRLNIDWDDLNRVFMRIENKMDSSKSPRSFGIKRI